ncbi:MAG: type II toxin-antitoxin system VapC family toxin [Candidatus Omnitrophica bacterium]|nr:type II toxin-antitoxin system VapC family toxin [Candidatus Omnitrophota bacterium]MCB9781968.1 type II toxin-antitoxin system VapC family toxin [Candidatus Omnitrophota bacterium]
MSYLLDTSTICEVTKKTPNAGVIEWLSEIDDRFLFMSVLSLGEIGRGIECLPASRKRDRLKHWLEHDLTEWFEERVLPIDRNVCELWGRMLSRKDRTMPAIDSLFAATANYHRLTIVTRNAKDFDYPEIDVMNPWSPE